MEWTRRHIEALIFAAEQPIRQAEIRQALEEAFGTTFDPAFLQSRIDELVAHYRESDAPFEIAEIDEGYIFLTKPDYHDTIGAFLKQSAGKKLSNAALETLAIIAYQQPVGKSEIESIRGVSCDYLIQKLLEKDLIRISGRDEGPGRPLLYATSERFMNYFGLKSIKDLPKLKDFKTPENSIGVQDNAMEN